MSLYIMKLKAEEKMKVLSSGNFRTGPRQMSYSMLTKNLSSKCNIVKASIDTPASSELIHAKVLETLQRDISGCAPTNGSCVCDDDCGTGKKRKILFCGLGSCPEHPN